MKAVEFIRVSLESSARATLSLLEDMKDQPLTFPTPRGGNHPLWILGHLAYTEGFLTQEIMLGRANPVGHWKELFWIGSQASAEASRYPTFDELHKAFQDLRAETMKTLATLSDEVLDRPTKGCPPEMKELLGTYAQCYRGLIFNTMHHRGQAADVRRAAGRKPLRM
jgi:uncharacterized damage-inducible protein DinB